tara:strand:- start:1481 stop:2263 length:783 start_codon:yes stop_codon:yes gene_type:complete
MIYITGARGLIGTRFRELYSEDLIQITFRDYAPKNVFRSHEKSCLIHLGWSSTTRTNDPDQVERDVINSQNIFNYYLEKNPNGKIIFLSTAGNMHQHKVEGIADTELSQPNPLSLYGHAKLKVENILKELDCSTVVLRVSNVWGAKVDENRVNGLVDKLRSAVDTDRVIEIYTDIETMVDLVHVDDLISLIIKVIDRNLNNHELFLVGGQTISIYDIISKVSKMGSLNLRLNQKGKEKSFINILPLKAEKTFNWNREYYL